MPWGARRIGSLAAAAVFSALLAPQLADAEGFGSFAPTGSMGSQRSRASAAPLPDGRVLVAGGYNGSPDPNTAQLANAEAFNPATGSFSSAGIGPTTKPLAAAAAAPLADGRVLFAGGSGRLPHSEAYGDLDLAEAFDPATGGFSLIGSAGIVPTGHMSIGRSNEVAAPLPDGRVLIAGGFEGLLGTLASAEAFEPAADRFSTAGIGSMTTPRLWAVAAPLPDGRVLIAGGASNPSSPTALASAELFDPATGSFSSLGIGSMGTPREGAVAAPLLDGRVLIAGGRTGLGSEPLASAEIFNPASKSFSSLGIGSMGTPRLFASAASLPDGRVLVAGGNTTGGGIVSSAEIYGATNVFYTVVKGLKLLIKVSAFGQVKVSDAAAKAGAAASKRRRRRLLLKPSRARGGPGEIVVRLRLTRLAKRALRKKGRLRVRTRITFAPQGGLANTRTVRLKLKAKRRKKSHRRR